MINQVVLVGKVKALPLIKETSSGIKYTNLCVEIKRGYPNSDGDFEKDSVWCTVWRTMAETCAELCELDSVVGVKGRIQSSTYTNAEGQTYWHYEIVAEKITFLEGKDDE